MHISSPSNPRIKALALLHERKQRERQGRFLIEGAREIERAMAAGIELEQIFVAEQLSREEDALLQSFASHLALPPFGTAQNLPRVRRGVEPSRLSAAALKKLSSRENPAGIIGLAQVPQRALSDHRLSPTALILVAVGLEKPGNLGAVLRSADAAGAEAVIAVGGVDLWSPQVIRNSTGVVFSLPTFAAGEAEALGWLKAQNLELVAATPHSHLNYWDANLRGPVALVVGPEHEGLSDEWLSAAHTQVRIPMGGQADSLNASVSAALLLYEGLRQRKYPG
jgi:TrmH family RNA methyltransferase